ncbi:ABC-type Zn uptake system ZnuABC Zn-binding protein ZnuA [Lipingzhangella halophila]|uniref:ABC-type Zn uptake system ZnuABC Zn-binding protein ZnuA n=1 Tax=Lipingzhangella halophila TaxID=1783352 RepID=A0A7W7RMV7_9ACTN|nr:metal ABC transporter substrate-binding protein [Lipingzhangella halophila]MBB4934881.1 ABC-type Zn uptake system ZnuABC Zn-binding protein ZnuA [Lipingzhangella halophila]
MARWRAFVLVIALAGTSCGGSGAGGDTAEPAVATTVAPITDITERIAGDDAEVTGIVPPGVDSHTFEPGPSVVRDVAGARLFIANGLHLEESSLEIAEANLPDDGEIVTLADQVVTEDEWVYDFTFPEEAGVPNPHLWTSPPMAAEYARIIAGELERVDPGNAEGYQERYDAYSDLLAELDAAIEEAVRTVPEDNRKLVTYHDSFPYFAPHYGFEVVGAVQPADFSEPSVSEVAELIDQIEREEVPAVFGSEVFPSDVLEQIAEESGARYVDELRDDELPGEPGDPEHSYVGMMLANSRAIVDALGGDPAALDAVDPA